MKTDFIPKKPEEDEKKVLGDFNSHVTRNIAYLKKLREPKDKKKANQTVRVFLSLKKTCMYNNIKTNIFLFSLKGKAKEAEPNSNKMTDDEANQTPASPKDSVKCTKDLENTDLITIALSVPSVDETAVPQDPLADLNVHTEINLNDSFIAKFPQIADLQSVLVSDDYEDFSPVGSNQGLDSESEDNNGLEEDDEDDEDSEPEQTDDAKNAEIEAHSNDTVILENPITNYSCSHSFLKLFNKKQTIIPS